MMQISRLLIAAFLAITAQSASYAEESRRVPTVLLKNNTTTTVLVIIFQDLEKPGERLRTSRSVMAPGLQLELKVLDLPSCRYAISYMFANQVWRPVGEYDVCHDTHILKFRAPPSRLSMYG